MIFLLDTDICIYAIKGNETVLNRLLKHPPALICISVITESELRTGAAKSTYPARTLEKVDRFLEPFEIVEYTSSDAAIYAPMRAALEQAGTKIGDLDTLIAAQALARGLTLVTNNQREFGRVAGLSLENWSRAR